MSKVVWHGNAQTKWRYAHIDNRVARYFIRSPDLIVVDANGQSVYQGENCGFVKVAGPFNTMEEAEAVCLTLERING